MTQPSKSNPNKPVISSSKGDRLPSSDRTQDRSDDGDIAQTIIKKIHELKNLKDYPIRDLVQHAEKLGPALKQRRLETNQIRKFLDAVNQIKAELANKSFEEIEVEVVLLKPKLAYAAARQDAVKLLSQVISAAIDKVSSKDDFERLVQLMESIIAYHKAVEGK